MVGIERHVTCIPKTKNAGFVVRLGILFAILPAFLAISCAAQRYGLVPEPELATWAREELPLSRHFIIPVPLGSYGEETRDVIVQVIRQAQEGQLQELGSYLMQVETGAMLQEPDLAFCHCVYHIFRGQFGEANSWIDGMAGETYTCLQMLLRTDIAYELARREKKANRSALIGEYQKVLDCYSRNADVGIYSPIIGARIKYIRYH